MKKYDKDIKAWLMITLTAALVLGSTITSMAFDTKSNDSKLWIEFGDLNNERVLEPFDYHGVECYYVKPGNNEFKFVKEKSSVTDIADLDYNVNLLVFNENSKTWEWCELGGDMTTGDFEYDKVFKMIVPEATKIGMFDWSYDFSKGEDMTGFTDDKLKAYCDENGYKYAGNTPDWLIHIYVTDHAGENSRRWEWYFKPNAEAENMNKTADANNEIPQPKWMKNEKGWWIGNADGTYIINAWYQSPESSLWYYMGVDGYMLTNTTTPDGFKVGADGVWIQ